MKIAKAKSNIIKAVSQQKQKQVPSFTVNVEAASEVRDSFLNADRLNEITRHMHL